MLFLTKIKFDWYNIGTTNQNYKKNEANKVMSLEVLRINESFITFNSIVLNYLQNYTPLAWIYNGLHLLTL